VNILLLLAVFAGLAYKMTPPENRERYLAIAMRHVRRLKLAAAEPGPEYEAFQAALRARTRHALVAPAIAGIGVLIVIGMIGGAGAIGDRDTLLAWGANLGTRTTNGEWWRLLTSPFVHTGTLHLLVNAAVLIQMGAVLERLAGRFVFAAVYLGAGIFAGLVSISSYPVAVTTGASGAIAGLYGLLLAVLTWQTVDELIWLRSRRRLEDADGREDGNGDENADADARADRGVTIPLMAMKRLGVGAAVFFVYSALAGLLHTAEFAGLAIGLIHGLVLGRRAGHQQPSTRYVGAAMAATALIAALCAVPLRHIVDVTPEILGVLATEERTAAAFQTARGAFGKQRIGAEALAQLAELTIVPELEAADARLEALGRVPLEHQELVADAREYLRLRATSWRAQAAAIRKMATGPRAAPAGQTAEAWRLQAEARLRSNTAATGKAEGTDRASLQAFSRLKTTAPLLLRVR
jgi:membrane associated rhomboid family serine protease